MVGFIAVAGAESTLAQINNLGVGPTNLENPTNVSNFPKMYQYEL